jgi:Na+-transporting NADH:ubiquinone oxidoreductase subunit C
MVALALCIVCSLVVSTAAVMLKPAQDANKEMDRQRNILAAAGLLNPDTTIEEQFKQVEVKVVDLRTGKYTDAVDPATYNELKAAKDPGLSQSLDKAADIAKISSRENYALVYLVKKDGKLDTVVLPIRGLGLWSTLYGFIALEKDLDTIAGLGFYQHGETPGLGGEVDNPRWKSQWPGKEAYKDGDVAIHLVKGTAAAGAAHQIDGLSGATLTSVGVTNLVQFWLGKNGFQPYLNNLKAGDA